MADPEKRIAALEKQCQAQDRLITALKEAHNNQHDVVKSLLEQDKTFDKTITALKDAHNNQHYVVKSLLERVAELERQIKAQAKLIDTQGGGI